jgi:hypothetical protein
VHEPSRTRSALVAFGVTLAVLLGLGLGVGLPAAGQATTSDPYGSTIPPTEPPGDPLCLLDGTQVAAGATVTGLLSGLEAGATVDVVLGALDVGEVDADESGTAAFSFVVPAGSDDEAVVAVGVTFTVECGLGVEVDADGNVGVLSRAVSGDAPAGGGEGPAAGGTPDAEALAGAVDPGTEVLAAEVVRLAPVATAPASTPGAAATPSGRGAGSGALARTGAVVVPLLACGVVALVVGAALRRRSRARVAA